MATLDSNGYVPMGQINPAIATDVELAAAIAAHLAAIDPHPQYTTDAEVVAVMAAHLAALDPHPQYAMKTLVNEIRPLFHNRIWRTR